MMKKSIVTVLGITLSALAAVVTSCTNDEVIASAERHGGKVGFGFSVEQMEGDGAVNTRAAAIVSQVMDGSGDSPVYLTTATTGYVNSRISGSSAATKGVSVETNRFYDNFGLFIYEYDANSNWENQSSPTPNVNNQKMLKSSGWITDKYWPGNQKKLTFFGYAPHSTEYTSVSVSNTPGAPTLSYTVPTTVSDQKDLLVTKHTEERPTKDIAGNKNQVVNMVFYHALTAVQFKIGGTMAPCTIKTITVEGVNSKGTYNFSNDAWTSQSTPATYTISPNYEVSSNSGRNNIFTNTSDMLMLLMPQTLPNDAKITITINDGGTSDRTLTLPIKGQVWQAGHSVTYTLSTASEDDTYQISVTDATLNEKGGSATCSVTSYRQTYYGTQIPVGWTATYCVDDETTELTGNSEYVTSFTSSNDNPNATATNLSATLDKLYFVSDAGSNQKTSSLRGKDFVGADDNHYNLSNSSGAADIQNTANCYIVNAPGYYRIPMVYGNGIKDGSVNSASIVNRSTFVNSDGNAINKAKISEMQTINNAVLVWQDAYHLIDPKSVKIKGDFIEFYIPKKYICEGNAVLAARDNNDNILWSWHIWVTGEELSSSTNVNVINRNSTQYNFMKLPLGFCHADTRKYPTRNIHITITQNGGSNQTATANIIQSSESSEILGVNAPYYQYGRKDPFCPSNGNGNTNKTLYDSQIGVTDFKSQSGAVGTNVSIQNPHIFYYVQDSHWNNSDSYEFWDVGNSDNGLYDAANHKSVKSVYDPSPVGYKTPEPAAWTRFTTYNNGDNTSSLGYFNVANKSSFSDDGGWKFYTQADGRGDWDLWHALGFRDVYSQRTPTAGTGGLLRVGSDGDYWSCGPSTTAADGRNLNFGSGGVYPQDQDFRAYGFTVRPVSEQ